MSSTIPSSSSSLRGWLIAIVAVGGIAAAAWATSARWLPSASTSGSTEAGHDEQDSHDHAGHDHADTAATSIELSKNALKNIGYQPVKIALGSFERKITVPAMIVEQAGRNQIHVTSPLTGVVSDVLIVPGEAVEPHFAMFHIRLTHEDVVTAQRDLLLNIESLDVVNRELARLQALGEGVIAGKRILEQQYDKQKSTLR